MTNNDQDIEKSALAVLEIGEHREGYWNSDRFMEKVGKAVRIADVKYPPSQGYHHVWCFDHSCGHASKMNKGPGGKQPKMRDTVWNGQPQTMTLPDGRPKGAALVLEERCYNTKGWMKCELFLSTTTTSRMRNAVLTLSRPYMCFHPQVSLRAESVWSQSKRYTRAYCDYTISSLRRSIPLGLKTVRRCSMFAYLEGSAVGQELEEMIKFYKSVTYTSHRRVSTEMGKVMHVLFLHNHYSSLMQKVVVWW